MVMTQTGRRLMWGALLGVLAQSAWGQPASPWRAFKAADGLPEAACYAVTVSERGTVLLRHLVAPVVTRLDGYGVATFPAPPTRTGRVYETRSGQLWAPATNGLFEFTPDGWILHPVPEIAAESAAWGTSLAQGLPLHPVRQGRVLFLLRDRLMMFNAHPSDAGQTEVLRAADQTRLGSFLSLAPARDGGLWISGARGLAKLPPAIRLRADSPWQEFEVPDTLRVENLREPREDEAGVVAIAESALDHSPLVIRFAERRWSVIEAGVERVRFAWVGPEQTRWVATPSALLCGRGESGELLPSDDCSARRFFDMAMEPGGAFWLATLDGALRYAPAIWQTPAAARAATRSVSCCAEDEEGRLWFVSGGELHWVRDREHQSLPLPDPARRALQTTRALIPLPNGILLFDGGDQLFRWRPAGGRLERLPAEPGAGRLRFLGLLKDRLAVLQRFSGDAASEPQLETCDGEQFKPFTTARRGGMPAVGRSLSALFQSRNGELWVAGEKGLARQREDGWTAFLPPEKPAPVAAQFFTETPDGRVWCATTDQVWVFDGRNWTLQRDGFDHINSLAHDNAGNVWVATNTGLYRGTPAGWIENDVEDGLPGPVVRSLTADRRGRIWAGTSQGLSVYHPEADPDPPQTVILTPADQRVPEGGSLTVTFGGQDKWKFTSHRHLAYSCRLDDGEWSPFQERTSATFSELPAGRHRFQVRARDRNGNVEAKPAQLAFVVPLPWFKETRLVLIAALGSAAVLFFAALAFNRHRQLRRSYAEVERKVAERTRELEVASHELLHSQKMNALGTLAAGIAHDFNNILSIVKGSAQIIEEHLDHPDKIRTRLDRIKTVVEQGTGIVQAMLGFSRASDGRLELCDLNAIVRNTVTLLGDRFLRETGVRIEAAADLPAVPTAKDFVQQILLNFIFNAAEAMGDGAAPADAGGAARARHVVLRTASLAGPPPDLVLKPAAAPRYVAVSVQDFGCGIPPENLPRVFEPFFTTKALSVRRGTGLGLSMVYELARRMNAGLAVQSAVGRGSTFTLILPVPESQPQT
jgi:signal transduction histidine kinase/ligand-binding sensor domain-containing protein